MLDEAVYQYQKTVRKMILKDHKRPDGRRIDQIARWPLGGFIPRVHGSAMFTRGRTQICDVVTPGSALRDAASGRTG